jgi:Fe2+ or Zn2+ uptake regulation protein
MNFGQLHNYLDLHRVKRSNARDLIFETLWYEGPCSIKELLIFLEGKVSQATVYNAVPVFTKLLIIEEVRPGVYEISNIFRQHRHFFTCDICRKRIPYRSDKLESEITITASRHNFETNYHRIEIFGTCPTCALLVPRDGRAPHARGAGGIKHRGALR